jgi:hypothetical protein
VLTARYICYGADAETIWYMLTLFSHLFLILPNVAHLTGAAISLGATGPAKVFARILLTYIPMYVRNVHGCMYIFGFTVRMYYVRVCGYKLHCTRKFRAPQRFIRY